MTDIILSADRLSWSAPPQHGSMWDRNPGMLKWRPRVLARDKNTCQGCGFKADKFQEIHHRNGDHSDFREVNLETLCPLCHQVFHPVMASISMSASMIWLPEMTQVELNRLLFAIFSVMPPPDAATARKKGEKVAAHPLATVASGIYSQLDNRKVSLCNQFGKSDPGVYGQLLLNMSKEDYARRGETMAPIKMMANPARFKTEIEYWAMMLGKEHPRDAIEKSIADIQFASQNVLDTGLSPETPSNHEQERGRSERDAVSLADLALDNGNNSGSEGGSEGESESESGAEEKQFPF